MMISQIVSIAQAYIIDSYPSKHLQFFFDPLPQFICSNAKGCYCLFNSFICIIFVFGNCIDTK